MFMYRREQEEEGGRGSLEDATLSRRLSELREEIGRLKQRLVPASPLPVTSSPSSSLSSLPSLAELVHKKRTIAAAVSHGREREREISGGDLSLWSLQMTSVVEGRVRVALRRRAYEESKQGLRTGQWSSHCVMYPWQHMYCCVFEKQSMKNYSRLLVATSGGMTDWVK